MTLPVVGEIGAGQASLLALSPGHGRQDHDRRPGAHRAPTPWCPYEWTDRGAAKVRITQAPAVGQHVRHAGEDVAEGDLLVEPAPCSGRATSGCSPSVGRATVRRAAPPAGGGHLDRLRAARAGHRAWATTRSTTRNSYLLAAAVRAAGAIAYRVGIVPDEPAAFLDALSDQLVRADLVVTSGGVSQGDYDVVKEALAPLGTVWFGGVAMQPGKPQGFGFVGEDGEARVPIFTLPGNPVSSYVSFQVFVLPALRRMMGRTPASPPDPARPA